MKPAKLAAWAMLAVALTELPAQAAWNNVFQPTLFGRLNRSSTSSYYCQSCAPVVAQYVPVPAPAPACNTCQSAPTQQCTTNYVQRSFYQPVTTYETRSYYEPVTTYQTSYYYEAVTSYHTSYYPDPCKCGGYIAKSCPTTSYQLKQQNCPVQSWVQRCAQVPVQSYKLSYYLEPQTTCTSVGAPVPISAAPPPCPQGCAPTNPTPTPSPTPSYSSPQPPVIDQQRTPPPGPSGGGQTSYYPNSMTTNQTKPASNWQPSVDLGPIAPEPRDLVQGQIVRNDRSSSLGAQVLFVNAAMGARHSAAINDIGRFNLALGSGSYHVYLANSAGSAAYHSQVNVDPKQSNMINLINN
jgi:hypothetical protein